MGYRIGAKFIGTFPADMEQFKNFLNTPMNLPPASLKILSMIRSILPDFSFPDNLKKRIMRPGNRREHFYLPQSSAPTLPTRYFPLELNPLILVSLS